MDSRKTREPVTGHPDTSHDSDASMPAPEPPGLPLPPTDDDLARFSAVKEKALARIRGCRAELDKLATLPPPEQPPPTAPDPITAFYTY